MKGVLYNSVKKKQTLNNLVVTQVSKLPVINVAGVRGNIGDVAYDKASGTIVFYDGVGWNSAGGVAGDGSGVAHAVAVWSAATTMSTAGPPVLLTTGIGSSLVLSNTANSILAGSTVIGRNVAGSDGAVVVGVNSSAGVNSTVIGKGIANSNSRCIAIGNGSFAQANDSISIGSTAGCGPSATNSIAIGDTTRALGANAVGMGAFAQAAGDNSVSIGNSSNAQVSSTGGVALGNSSACAGLGGVAIGESSSASGDEGVAIGPSAIAHNNGAVAIGNGADSSQAVSIALGVGATVDADHQLGLPASFNKAAGGPYVFPGNYIDVCIGGTPYKIKLST
jgi:hypothetical protein